MGFMWGFGGFRVSGLLDNEACCEKVRVILGPELSAFKATLKNKAPSRCFEALLLIRPQ